MKKLNKIFFAVVLLILLYLLPTYVLAQEYSIKGQTSIFIYKGLNDGGKEYKYNFALESSQSNFNITISTIGKESDYQQYSYANGTMHILHHLTRITSLPGQHFSTNGPIIYPASIETRDVPPNDGWSGQFLWLAYASKELFLSLTNTQNIMLPIWSPEDPQIRKQPFDMLVYYTLFNKKPSLPSAVYFINDGYYRSYNPSTQSLDVFKLSPPYDKGFTNAVYEAFNAVSINGFLVPSNWTFTVYSTPFENEVQFTRMRITGQATSIGNTASTVSRPPSFVGIADVADYRISGAVNHNGTNINYSYASFYATNKLVEDTNQLRELPKTPTYPN